MSVFYIESLAPVDRLFFVSEITRIIKEQNNQKKHEFYI